MYPPCCIQGAHSVVFFWGVLGESESWIQLSQVVSNDKSVPVLPLCAEQFSVASQQYCVCMPSVFPVQRSLKIKMEVSELYQAVVLTEEVPELLRQMKSVGSSAPAGVCSGGTGL